LKKFAEVYQDEILTFDIKNVDLICKSVVRSVKESVWISTKPATSTTIDKNGQPLKERKFVLTAAEPNWKDRPTLEGVFITYDDPRSIDAIVEDVPLKQNEPKRVKIKIADQPFARGVERIAYYGKDLAVGFKSVFGLSSDKDIVLKEYVHEYSGDIAKRFESSNQVQTIASFLAERFCYECGVKANTKVAIEFLKTKTLSIKNSDGSYRHMTCEDRFAPGFKFIRFSNNVDYQITEEQASEYGILMDYVEILMSFSHWTYKVTDGMLMVVDLQGVITKDKSGVDHLILTDPAIHCIDSTRFGTTNLSKKGMEVFLKRHVCNSVCKALGLDK
jgi:hypothetical protein